jgi:hypothetical protein
MKEAIRFMRDQMLLQQIALNKLAADEDNTTRKSELLDTVKTSSDHVSALNHVLRALD